MLNFCRRKRSFQWCLDQSDRPNGAQDMHENAQNVERKTQTKICCHYTWLLHVKSRLSQWCFLRSFFNRKQAQWKAKHYSKKERKGEKGKAKKKFQKSKSLKTKVTFSSKNYLKILISVHSRGKMSQNTMLVAREPSCRDASAFLTRLKLIWQRSSLKATKMSKKRLFHKKLRGSMG